MKLDKRRKYYLVLDCETATLPCVSKMDEEQRKTVAIAKPLIYDIGWQIVDRNGNVYDKQNFLISEVFSVPALFDTAYYKDKRPVYLDKLSKGEMRLTDWNTAMTYLVEAMTACEAVGAYNAMFDFKKAIPFTELYISQLYSPDYHEWLKFQEGCCEWIANHRYTKSSNNTFDPDLFRFRGVTYDLFDLWGLTCRHLLNCDEYKEMCCQNGWATATGKYFKTSAETAFRFLSEQMDFDEAHTALDDAEIESQLFAKISAVTKNKWEMGIIFFPFRELGKVADWAEANGYPVLFM